MDQGQDPDHISNSKRSVNTNNYSEVAPAPSATVVIDKTSLHEALINPQNAIIGTYNHSPTRSSRHLGATGESGMLSFLSQFNVIKLSHNCCEECICCCLCNCKDIVDFTLPRNQGGGVILIAKRNQGCCCCSCIFQNSNVYHVTPNDKELVIVLEFERKSCTIPTNTQVYSPPGNSIGYIESLRGHWFEIKDANKEVIYTCNSRIPECCGHNEYPVINKADSSKVAEMIEVGSCCETTLTVTFLQDIPPSRRALILAMGLLVDFYTRNRQATNEAIITA